jgi:hypothetical protein
MLDNQINTADTTTTTGAVIKRPSRLECSKCGALMNAACNCGAPYVSAGARAAAAVTANPEKSDRAIAAEIGVGKDTVRRARTGAHAPVEKRIGQDGRVWRPPVAKLKTAQDPVARPLFTALMMLVELIDDFQFEVLSEDLKKIRHLIRICGREDRKKIRRLIEFLQRAIHDPVSEDF